MARNNVRRQAAIEAAQSHVTYAPGELTYNQRQMAAFNAGRTVTPSTRETVAKWANDPKDHTPAKSGRDTLIHLLP